MNYNQKNNLRKSIVRWNMIQKKVRCPASILLTPPIPGRHHSSGFSRSSQRTMKTLLLSTVEWCCGHHHFFTQDKCKLQTALHALQGLSKQTHMTDKELGQPGGFLFVPEASMTLPCLTYKGDHPFLLVHCICNFLTLPCALPF